MNIQLKRLFALIPLCFYVGSVSAEVTFDGTIGPNAFGTARTGDFTISQSDGVVAGSNLFHSFDTFNVNTGESAAFTSSASVNNIISRVTGTEVTNIYGNLSSDSSLWLMNDNGIVVGEGASFDVAGGLHLSTADSLTFSNGQMLNLETSQEGISVLAFDPQEFGFLGGANGDILVSNLTYYDNQLYLFAENVEIDQVHTEMAGLTVNAGRNVTVSDSFFVNSNISALGSIVAENIALGYYRGRNLFEAQGDISITNLTGDFASQLAIESLGDLTIAGEGRFETDGGGGGSLRGANVLLSGNYTIQADEGSISLAIESTKGNLIIDGDASGGIVLDNRTFFSRVAPGPSSIVSANDLFIRNLTYINSGDNFGLTPVSSNLWSAGRDVLISDSTFSSSVDSDLRGAIPTTNSFIAGRSLHMENVDVDTSSVVRWRNYWQSEVLDTKVSNLLIAETGNIVLLNSSINSRTIGENNGGNITLRAFNSIEIAGSTLVTTAEDISYADGGEINASGDAGSISFSADSVALTGLSLVSSSTEGSGSAGDVSVSAEKNILIDNAEILANTLGVGDAGSISLSSENITLTNNGKISSKSIGIGQAGDINITDTNRLEITKNQRNVPIDQADGSDADAAILTSSTQSGGGNVTIKVKDYIGIVNSDIVTKAAMGGGNISIDPQLLFFDSARLDTSAVAGSGGKITVQADQIIRSLDTDFDSRSETGVDGEVAINGVTNEVGQTETIQVDYSNVASLLSQKCQVGQLSDRSSFVVAAEGGTSRVPGEYLLSSLKSGSNIAFDSEGVGTLASNDYSVGCVN